MSRCRDSIDPRSHRPVGVLHRRDLLGLNVVRTNVRMLLLMLLIKIGLLSLRVCEGRDADRLGSLLLIRRSLHLEGIVQRHLLLLLSLRIHRLMRLLRDRTAEIVLLLERGDGRDGDGGVDGKGGGGGRHGDLLLVRRRSDAWKLGIALRLRRATRR